MISIVAAKSNIEQATAYAELDYIASRGGGRQLYGPKWRKMVAYLYLQPDTNYSYRHTCFAYVNDSIAGHVTYYVVDDSLDIAQATRRSIASRSRVVLMRRDFVGFCRKLGGIRFCRVPPDDAYIAALAVLPDYRRLGIAERILVELTDHLQSQEIGALHLDVYRGNVAAIALYEKAGFSFDKADRYPRSCIRTMSKPLALPTNATT